VGGRAAESANQCEKEEEKTNKTNFTNSTSFLHHFSIIVCYTESRRGGNPAMIWTSANHCEKEE
jgi:hypothetical protein